MDREPLIVRQSVLKAAASAVSAGTVGIPSDEIAARTVAIAEYFLEWVYEIPGSIQASADRTQAQTASQTPSSVSEGVPDKCPQCGCKVRDNRADNITRAQQGKVLRPVFACNGKWQRQPDGSFTQIQKECGWVIWPEKTNV